MWLAAMNALASKRCRERGQAGLTAISANGAYEAALVWHNAIQYTTCPTSDARVAEGSRANNALEKGLTVNQKDRLRHHGTQKRH
jgi:hypothetical protein